MCVPDLTSMYLSLTADVHCFSVYIFVYILHFDVQFQ